jgi:hypothetical protein
LILKTEDEVKALSKLFINASNRNAVGRPASILTKGDFLVSKDFYSHQQSWWLFFAKATK